MTFFFFNDTATTEIYTLSLHDALPISYPLLVVVPNVVKTNWAREAGRWTPHRKATVVQGNGDRKSTRLNSSHANISYAVFCLKKKKTTSIIITRNISVLTVRLLCLIP